MKYLYVQLLFCLCLFIDVKAQRTAFQWHEKRGDKYVGINLSATRYCGDLSERYNFAHLQLGWSSELHTRYRLDEQLCLSSTIGVYHIRADQRFMKNPTNNLSFSSTNFSANLGVQWDVFSVDFNQRNIPYLIAGIGLTRLAPVTMLDGFVYSLPAFQTEGYAYAQWVGQVNYGVGFPVVLSPVTQFRIEGRYTHVLSDYLDDVSSQYVSKASASDVEKKLAAKCLATGAVPNLPGSTRGNPSQNDGYFLLTFQFVYKFR